MSLDAYMSDLPRGGAAEAASKLGISTVYLAQIRARQDGREASPELCVRIEAWADRRVMRWHLRPNDWHLIWPELIGVEGAPAVPAAEAMAEIATDRG